MREYGVDITIREFVELFYRWAKPKSSLYLPRALVMSFLDEPLIAPLIAEHDAWQQAELEQKLFDQRKRLVEAERKLQTKTTKAALESQRIASANSRGPSPRWRSCGARCPKATTFASSLGTTRR